MTQKIPGLSYWFLTDDYRAKAQLKYELKQLETRLHQLLKFDQEQTSCHQEITMLCAHLAQKYMNYLKLVDLHAHFIDHKPSYQTNTLNWTEQYSIIAKLKQRLSKMANQNEECKLIAEIAFLYRQCANQTDMAVSGTESTDELKQLFRCTHLKKWFSSLVTYWNRIACREDDLSLLFDNWQYNELQSALNFFSEPQLVNLANALFFYKLFPEKLFDELIHPEKLVSVRMRLGVIHEFIELLQQKLYRVASQHGLKSKIDYLFHGDDLPQGILIDVDAEYREIIQIAVKSLKIKSTPENEEQITIERLHDLGRAYKYWFNPNRLIDAVMILQQRLVKCSVPDNERLSVFHQEMLRLYSQLTTTKCLDLYGYFANNDSRYLLYTLFTIVQDKTLDWLPLLTASEKNAVVCVFNALRCVMEALREELKNRHVTTEPYAYDLEKNGVKVRRRNRDAVLRLIAIYGRAPITVSDSLKKLFDFIEDHD